MAYKLEASELKFMTVAAGSATGKDGAFHQWKDHMKLLLPNGSKAICNYNGHTIDELKAGTAAIWECVNQQTGELYYTLGKQGFEEKFVSLDEL